MKTITLLVAILFAGYFLLHHSRSGQHALNRYEHQASVSKTEGRYHDLPTEQLNAMLAGKEEAVTLIQNTLNSPPPEMMLRCGKATGVLTNRDELEQQLKDSEVEIKDLKAELARRK